MRRRPVRGWRRCRTAPRAAGRGARSGSGAAMARWPRRGWVWTGPHGARSSWACARQASTLAVRTVCSVRGRGRRFGAGSRRAGRGRPGIWTVGKSRRCAVRRVPRPRAPARVPAESARRLPVHGSRVCLRGPPGVRVPAMRARVRARCSALLGLALGSQPGRHAGRRFHGSLGVTSGIRTASRARP